eukprot:scaffold295555_cov28-Tisochrysis_lutea.AAC.10
MLARPQLRKIRDWAIPPHRTAPGQRKGRQPCGCDDHCAPQLGRNPRRALSRRSHSYPRTSRATRRDRPHRPRFLHRVNEKGHQLRASTSTWTTDLPYGTSLGVHVPKLVHATRHVKI